MSPLSSNIVEAIKMAKDRLLKKANVLFDESYEFEFTKNSFVCMKIFNSLGWRHPPFS